MNMKDKLRGAFGQEVMDELTTMATPEVAKPQEEKKKDNNKRSIGDIFAAVEAQRIYDPNMPQTSRPSKHAPKHMAEQGMTENMQPDTGWGTTSA
jgi:hypothetical protein